MFIRTEEDEIVIILEWFKQNTEYRSQNEEADKTHGVVAN